MELSAAQSLCRLKHSFRNNIHFEPILVLNIRKLLKGNWEEFAPEGGNLYLTATMNLNRHRWIYKSMNMCGVVGHHHIGDFETDGPVFMRLEPVGLLQYNHH